MSINLNNFPQFSKIIKHHNKIKYKMEKLTIEIEIDIEMNEVYDRVELEKVLKRKLVGVKQFSSIKGHTFKITGVREI